VRTSDQELTNISSDQESLQDALEEMRLMFVKISKQMGIGKKKKRRLWDGIKNSVGEGVKRGIGAVLWYYTEAMLKSFGLLPPDM